MESSNQLQPRELADRIEAEIKALGLQPGDRVPTESELAGKLDITRHKVRKGIAWLKDHKDWVQIQGSGTYLPGGPQPRRPKEKTITVIGPLPPQMTAEFDEVQMRAMSRGYHILITNVSHVHIRHEWACLEAALARRVTAVCLEPLPTEPWDQTRLDALRAEDIKVALMSAPLDARDKYSLFTLDYAGAGRLGAEQLIASGSSRIFCLEKHDGNVVVPWHYQDWADAAAAVAADRQVPFTRICAPGVYDPVRLETVWDERAETVPVAPDAGYLCLQLSQAALLRRELRAAGIEEPRIFSLSMHRVETPFPYALLDNRARIRRMIKYALDGTISPRRRVTETVPPELVPASPDW